MTTKSYVMIGSFTLGAIFLATAIEKFLGIRITSELVSDPSTAMMVNDFMYVIVGIIISHAVHTYTK